MNELKRDWHGRVLAKEVSVIPTREWGYFIGLVLGDGYLRKNHARTRSVCLGSTKQEIVNLFGEVSTGLGLHCFLLSRVCNLTLPNAQKRTVTIYEGVIHSKQLYEFLLSSKKPDYHFEVPALVFQTQETLCGFLSGFFDAEGTIYLCPQRVIIRVISKHSSNLIQIQNGLDKLGIKSHIGNGTTKSSLTIADYTSRIKFKRLIGFRLKDKQARLEAMPELQRGKYYKEDYEKAFELRQQGHTLDSIAGKMNIPKGTIHGWLGRHKRPREMRTEEYYAKECKANLCSR